MFVSASKGESSDISSCEEDKEVLVKKLQIELSSLTGGRGKASKESELDERDDNEISCADKRKKDGKEKDNKSKKPRKSVHKGNKIILKYFIKSMDILWQFHHNLGRDLYSYVFHPLNQG